MGPESTFLDFVHSIVRHLPSALVRTTVRGVLVCEGKVLLVRAPWCAHHSTPGGGIEQNETPQAALVRELREELGFELPADARMRVHPTIFISFDLFFFLPIPTRAYVCTVHVEDMPVFSKNWEVASHHWSTDISKEKISHYTMQLFKFAGPISNQ
jgi:8-oxo-dGTP pyrophosphatase MutT (NUDIX family)